jgi:hypothetical protein
VALYGPIRENTGPTIYQRADRGVSLVNYETAIVQAAIAFDVFELHSNTGECFFESIRYDRVRLDDTRGVIEDGDKSRVVI